MEAVERKQRRNHEMPPKKTIEPDFESTYEESPVDILENRIAVLEAMVQKLYKAHYNPLYG